MVTPPFIPDTVGVFARLSVILHLPEHIYRWVLHFSLVGVCMADLLQSALYDSPLGRLMLVADSEQLHLLFFIDSPQFDHQVALLQKAGAVIIIDGGKKSRDVNAIL